MTRCILLVAVATKQFVSNLPFHHSSCLSSPRSTWINISVYTLYTYIYRLYIFSWFFCKEILSYSVLGNFFLNDQNKLTSVDMFSLLLFIIICWTFVERARRGKLKMFLAGSDVTHCLSLVFWRDKFQESFKLSLSRRIIKYMICTGNNEKTFKRWNEMKWLEESSGFYFMAQWPHSGPEHPHYRGFTITLRHTTLGRTPLAEWSARRRELYVTTHNIRNRQTSMTPAGLEPADPRLRPRGHWDRPEDVFASFIIDYPSIFEVLRKRVSTMQPAGLSLTISVYFFTSTPTP